MERARRDPRTERRGRPRMRALRPLTNWIYSLIRWIGGHVRGFYAAVGLFLLIGLAVTSGALLLFLVIAHGVAGEAVHRVDVGVLHWLNAHSAPWLDLLALVGTALGSGVATYVVLVVGGVALWRTRHHLSALLLVVALLGGRMMIGTLKELYARPRPNLFGDEIRALGMRFDYPESASFPSGHAITSVIVFGTLAYLTARVERTRHLRRITLFGALLLILLIGFSRLYFAVHYPSDVVAGVLVGLVWASFCAFSIEVIRYFRERKPEIAREEADLDAGLETVTDALRPHSAG